MDYTLAEQLIHSVFRFKKIGMKGLSGMEFHADEYDVNMAELALMKMVKDNAYDSDKNTSVSDIQDFLFITKAAVSQMFSSLEKKGYLNREIDKRNRRKLIVTLTPKGHEVLSHMEEKGVTLLKEIISRLGEDDTKQLIEIFDRFADIVEDLKDETLQTVKQNKV